jgi:hypothetical protein
MWRLSGIAVVLLVLAPVLPLLGQAVLVLVAGLLSLALIVLAIVGRAIFASDDAPTRRLELLIAAVRGPRRGESHRMPARLELPTQPPNGGRMTP